MGSIKIERLALSTIADAVKRRGAVAANTEYSFALGSRLDVSGTVQKVVKRDGQCKLVIEPGDVPGFVVFADCLSDAETVRNSKIRKGSSVQVKGKLQTFGARAACLTDCRLQGKKQETENLTKPHILGAGNGGRTHAETKSKLSQN